MSSARYDAGQVRQAAEGKWDRIINALAPDMGEAIKANGRGVSCPEHGGKSKAAFRVFGPRDREPFLNSGGCVCNTCGVKENGYITLQWRLKLHGKSGFVEVVNRVGDWLGLPQEEQDRQRPHQQSLPVKTGPTAEQLKAVEEGKKKLSNDWDTILDVHDEQAAVAREYLRHRGLATPASMVEVRVCLSEPYWADDAGDAKEEGQVTQGKKKFAGRFPCFKLKIRNKNRETYKLGRIYMAPDGSKFTLGDRKKPSHQSAALSNEGLHVELFPFTGGFLGITEGFENAVSVRLGIGMPCWPTMSSSYMPKFEPPKRCRHLFIWADRDIAGLKGAAKLALRLAVERPDLTVTIFLPPDGMDWNDVYKTAGSAGFRAPVVWQLASYIASVKKAAKSGSKPDLQDVIKKLAELAVQRFQESPELLQTA